MLEESSHGKVIVTLDEYLKKHNISKNYASRRANISRSRFNAYCRNDIQRVDLDILARLLDTLQCDITDLLRYEKE